MSPGPAENLPKLITIDDSRFEVCLDGTPVLISPKAFDVLHVLTQNRERVVEKEEIFSRVWGDSFVSDNALTRVVKEIRNAIGDDAVVPVYIATVPKRGYRFIGPVEFVAAQGIPSAISTGTPASKIENAVSARSPWTRAVGITAGAFLIALLGLALYWAGTSGPDTASVAVIPLENSTGDVELAYIAEGITESLINDLSTVASLRVIPRTSSYRYRASFVDPPTAGRDLGVQSVITGRMTRQNEEIVVQIELSDTASGSQIWGRRFTRSLADLISLESEIAREVASRVTSRLTSEEARRVGRTYTENAAAFEAYLRGRNQLNKLSPPAVRSAIEYFQKAIDIDPTYAPAYVGLADSNRALALALDGPANEYFPRSKAAAARAIEIDPDLAEAHAALGFATLFYDRDWRTAERHLKRALELNPNSSESRLAYSAVFTFSTRFDKGVKELARARELDPLNLRASALEGLVMVIAGNVDEGLARLHSTIEADPNFFLPHLFASSGYIEKVQLDKALEHATKARDLSNGQLESIATVGYVKGRIGDRTGAEAAIAELQTLRQKRYVPPYCFALVHNGLGETEKALEWLETGLRENDPKLAFLPGDPRWRNLKNDARFAALLNRIGFVAAK